jgi:DNA mismatch repair protein MutL
MPIHVLPGDVASQIAAGEVVERPASVVKELIENAIDAGATDLRIDVGDGGQRFVQVTDDGCGIPAAEVELAFHRHSTSKLETAEDLTRITTLGFRGEALASIAAVSRVTLATRSAEEPAGTLLRLAGSKIVGRQEIGRPPGSSVKVEDLFFNIPARRKFLRSTRTERRHIDACVTRYAMAYAGQRVTLTQDGRVTFQSPGNGRLRDVLIGVYGLEIGAAVLEVSDLSTHNGSTIDVRGLVSPPSVHRANRSFITLFVNGRWIQDSRLSYAAIQAYHTLLPNGRYPVAVIMVALPPEDVDVNVHPTKAEVRFRDADAVFRAVQRAVRRTLVAQNVRPAPARLPTEAPGTVWSQDQAHRRSLVDLRSTAAPGSRQFRFPGDGEGDPAPFTEGQPEPLPPLRVVGQVRTTYIIAEGPEGLYLIDQHAAHERVLYEQLLQQRQAAAAARQALLEPRLVELSPEAENVLAEHLDVLASLGLQAEPFGGTAMLVRAVPSIALQVNPTTLLEDIAAAMLSGDDPLNDRIEEVVARQVCKQAAVKAGQVMARAEMEELVQALERSARPHTCPHGRPTMIHLSAAQLASQFGRH